RGVLMSGPAWCSWRRSSTWLSDAGAALEAGNLGWSVGRPGHRDGRHDEVGLPRRERAVRRFERLLQRAGPKPSERGRGRQRLAGLRGRQDGDDLPRPDGGRRTSGLLQRRPVRAGDRLSVSDRNVLSAVGGSPKSLPGPRKGGFQYEVALFKADRAGKTTISATDRQCNGNLDACNRGYLWWV